MTFQRTTEEKLKKAVQAAVAFGKTFGGPTYSFPGELKGKNAGRSIYTSNKKDAGSRNT